MLMQVVHPFLVFSCLQLSPLLFLHKHTLLYVKIEKLLMKGTYLEGHM